MKLTDILGFELEEALAILTAEGHQVQDIKITKPIKEKVISSKARVVRIDQFDENGKIRVVVAAY